MFTIVCFVYWASSVCLACRKDSIAVFRLSLVTEWTRTKFPKQYPEFRPRAQWAPSIGSAQSETSFASFSPAAISESPCKMHLARAQPIYGKQWVFEYLDATGDHRQCLEMGRGATHSANFTLWRKNHLVTDEFRDYVQDSKTQTLQAKMVQDSNDAVMDSFETPRIPTGDGLTTVQFTADYRHHMLSFATRLIPSPDWFVGLDSRDLCHNATHWKTSFTVDLHPLDAGTDNGFTFTAPDFETEPRGVVTPITSRSPSHPACSFFYPQMQRLPRIAVVNVELIREDGRVRPGGHALTLYDSLNRVEDRSPAENEIKSDSGYVRKKIFPKFLGTSRRVRKRDRQTHGLQALDSKDEPRDCIVSEWAEWSPCDKLCGIGESRRTRSIVLESINGGAGCPTLKDRRWCGSFSTCKRKHFDWSR